MNKGLLAAFGEAQTVRFLSNTAGDIFDRYAKLRSLYKNNGAYDEIARSAVTSGVKLEALKPYRTPVNRSVEWFTSKLLPNASIQTQNETLRSAINQVLKWSNFEGKKRGYSRNFALYGDFFAKVIFDGSKVYFEEIKAKYVTDFSVDSRGYIVSIRIDIPVEDENGISKTYTEFWTSEDTGYWATWTHIGDRSSELDRLGTPDDSGFLADFGIDFVPVVLAQFIDFDGERGMGCTTHALDKIDELNRMVTRLHQILFRYNKPYIALLAPATDKEGKPLNLKPIKLGEKDGETDDYGDIDMTIARLGGYSDVKSMIANIDYASALEIIKAQENEIEKDLPELLSFSLEGSDLAGAGKALRLVLANAITRGNDARDNLVQALSRLVKMALSIGIYEGIFDASLGLFENGDFDDFSIVADEIMGLDANEKAVFVQMMTASGMALKTAMKLAGYSKQEIEEAVADKDEQDAKANASLVSGFLSNQRFAQDVNTGG